MNSTIKTQYIFYTNTYNTNTILPVYNYANNLMFYNGSTINQCIFSNTGTIHTII